uniref:Uncharacterized protein n=1 Tax=Euplotes crassus TaxID=5936 RepID=A0A7S3NWL5_EUPCR|mmetsp:Transcript_2494/g.2347  ORF Transcript_2494/g.2347 Transcript_2494/m.2347 type:complete len:274 (+) Transcript_2494:79-900(+)
MSIASSEKANMMEELGMKFINDSDYKESLIDLLTKVPKYFNKKPQSESMKYINALENLIGQHLNRFEKAKKKKLSLKDKEYYFLYIRDFLVRNKVTSGTLLEIWVQNSIGDSVEKINQSNTVKFDFDKLNMIINQLKETKIKTTLKNYNFKGDKKQYTCICYTIIKELLGKDFSKSGKPVTSIKNLIENIHHISKNYYNSKVIPPEQKALIKADRRIKYIIAEIFRARGIWREENDNFFINSSKVESFLNEINKYEASTILNNLHKEITQITS